MPFGPEVLALHFVTFAGPKPSESLRLGFIPDGRLNMSSPMSRDEALSLAAMITIVLACLVSGTAIGMSFWSLISKLLA